MDEAIAEWLAEFPALGRSALGQGFVRFGERFPEWRQARVTRLEEFYESEEHRRMAGQFGARLQELARSWSAE